ncbi:MAG TPA: alpha-2-macroglobulin family protein [Candidatus Angelobacter sp.]|nr:alpha-2-macroglobulin family protein [Candidatus Angelobacter sp.]
MSTVRCCAAWLVVVFSLLGRPAAQQNPGPLRVDEAKIRFHLLPESELELPIINSSSRTLDGTIQLELISGNLQHQIARKVPFHQETGSNVVKIPWSLNELPDRSPSVLGWYRLRYMLILNDKDIPDPVGMVQLGPLITDAFEVRMTASTSVSFGAKYPVHLRVDEPLSGRPCAKIPVDVELLIDGRAHAAAQVVTDESGYASTTFDLPKSLSSNSGKVIATAHRGEYSQPERIDFNFVRRPTLTVTTDKPLYQPGQAVHLRVLAFGPDKRAWKEAKVAVLIKDQENNELFRSRLVTSQFGVATADWNTPEKIRLGDYSILAETETSEQHDHVNAHSQVRLSRYDLPGFTVTATPDHSYYLPGDDASVEVRADYLFGKPVQRARVKVVETSGRYWNFKDQKWQFQENSPLESDLDEAGKSTIKVSLKGRFPAMPQRFADLPMAAYVTDLSTGRTEQRRFTLRLSAQPIHVYLFPGGDLNVNAPLQYYVTTSYPDGSPASATGELEAALPNDAGAFDQHPDAAHRRLLGKFRTNQFGVGRLDLAPLPEDMLLVINQYNPFRSIQWYGSYNSWRNGSFSYSDYVQRSALLLVHAADEKHRQGTFQEQVYLQPPSHYIRMRTDHSLYRSDEPIHVTAITDEKVGDMVVTVSAEAGLLISRLVHPDHGRAEVDVPYDSRFRGELQIAAHAIVETSEDQAGNPRASHALSGMVRVIYPAKHELQVGLRLAHTTFRPGEVATGDLRVRTPEGDAAESILGVLVFDRAVAERFRTDEDFGRGFGFSVFDYLDPIYQSSVAGVTYRNLLNLDSSKPFPQGLDLVAEAILHSGGYAWNSWNYGYGNYTVPQVESLRSAPDYSNEAQNYFLSATRSTISQVGEVLDKVYKATGSYPKYPEEFSVELEAFGLGGAVLDPWDVPYRPVFSVRGVYDVMSLVSNGVDKQPGTADDFTIGSLYWPYFARVGKAIDRAVAGYHSRTGKYIRDYPTLRDELKGVNINLDSLRDPWGTPYTYKFDVSGAYFGIRVESPGPDKRFDSNSKRSWDDLEEWFSRIHYFLDETDQLERALAQHFADTGGFPSNDAELEPVLKAANLTKEQLLDPWGHPYYFAYSKQSRYWDRIQTRVYSEEGERQRKTTEVTPVTQELAYVNVMSRGEPGTNVPFSVAEFSRVVAEQSSKELSAQPTSKEPPRTAGSGGISGAVTDPQGAVIQGAQVIAVGRSANQRYSTTTDHAGLFRFSSLPAGSYRLEVRARGFQLCIVLGVPVKPSGNTKVDASLRVGMASETVEVSSAAPMVESSSLDQMALLAPGVSSTFSGTNLTTFASLRRVDRQIDGQNNNDESLNRESPAAKQLFTPRVRQYFPETMLWRPDVLTDQKGLAHISFPMGDTITAWKMSVVASTESGQVGVAEEELRTFQPFFIEHDPPKVLTQGDRISLPVVLRNYTDKIQSILAELKPEDWFSILSAHRQSVTVPPNQDAKAVFSFEAASSTRHGKQQVTAKNTSTGDAVEREVLVHPNGEEISFSVAKLLAANDNTLSVAIPHSAIGNWNDAELRVYPNMMAHVFDAMRGIGSRPTGCGEQITSVGYINLLALQLLQKGGQDNLDAGNPRASVASGARRSVQETYDKLANVQMPDGGFGYWHDKSDVALTAYILRFLTSAGEFIRVNPAAVAGARRFLIARQAKSGAWQRYDWRIEQDTDNANLTAYVTRALAQAAAKTSGKEHDELEPALKHALEYLEDEIGSWRDPYLVGNYALAAAASGRKEYIARAQSLLNSLAHNEGPTTYWNLEANTSPFYGWGFAGRLETTALAVEALVAMRHETAASDATEEISRGLQYLLGHKDRYAVWYSTQATQNVLEAMIAALPPAQERTSAAQASVVVNGRTVSSIELPPGNTLVGPAIFELGQYLQKGTNQVQIVREGGLSAMNAAVLTSYYAPWGESSATKEESVQHGDTRALRLKVSFDHPDTTVDQTIVCNVQAERIGFKGYGMMMAEIGLPPGADVQRDSLEAARQSWVGINGYEVQPDRVVFYLWPSAGGTQFSFRFRLRYRMEALTTPSVIYDYYNPEARATVTPVRFTVR